MEKLSIKFIIFLTLFLALSGKTIQAQIAAANLNYNKSEAHKYYAPGSEAWNKANTFGIFGLYDTGSYTNSAGDSSGDELKDGTLTNINGGLKYNFFIQQIFFITLGTNYVSDSSERFKSANTSLKGTYDEIGGRVGAGILIREVLSLGIGYGQSQVTEVSELTGSNSVKSTTNLNVSTSAFSLGIRMGKFFVGGGADLKTYTNSKSKLSGSSQNQENELVGFTNIITYAGIGLSGGHPRDTQFHFEINYYNKPQYYKEDTTTKFYYFERGETGIGINMEYVYFDFLMGAEFKKITIPKRPSEDTSIKDSEIVNNEFKFSIGYLPAKGISFYIGMGNTTGNYTVEENFIPSQPSSFEEKRSSYNGELGFGFSY